MSEREINLGHTNTLHKNFLEFKMSLNGWKVLGSGGEDRPTWIVWNAPNGIWLEEIFGRVGEFTPRRLRLVDGTILGEITAKLKS